MKIQEVMAFGYKTSSESFGTAVNGLKAKIENSVIEVRVTQPHILNEENLRSAPENLRNAPKALDIKKRAVGQTSAQNQFAQVQAILAKGRGALAARINQRDADFS